MFLASIPALAHAFYKCVDEQGKTTYQKTACPADTSQSKVRVASHMEKSSAQRAFESDEFTGREFTTDESTEDTKTMLIRQQLASAIASLSALKITMADYHSANGVWPKRFSDIGINDSSMKSSTIESIGIETNGEFIVKLNSALGDHKKVLMKPEIVLGGTSIEWRCYANFTREVLSFSGRQICESSATRSDDQGNR